MALSAYYIGEEGDICKCNRRASIIHCIMCGSFKVRSIKDPRSMPPGTYTGETAWKCEKCGFGFPEHDKDDCHAPVYRTKTLQAAEHIIRTRNAISNNEPLTNKEEDISKLFRPKQVDPYALMEDDGLGLPLLTNKEIAALRKEWADQQLARAIGRAKDVSTHILRHRMKLQEVLDATDTTTQTESKPDSVS